MYLSDRICVIPASNTVTEDGRVLDYVKLASIAAERVKYYLGLDTCIITRDVDLACDYPIFATVIQDAPHTTSRRTMLSGNENITYAWANDSRISAYELTKGIAKKILIIDADYMVASDMLKPWIDSDSPFHIFGRAIGVYDSKLQIGKFATNDLNQYWATAMCWDESPEAEAIFETAKMVRDNYAFYAMMLGWNKSIFRNDLAFSVACHLNGITPLDGDSACLFNLEPTAKVIYRRDTSHFILDSQDRVTKWDFDLHIMNKKFAYDPISSNMLRLQDVKA